jgi:uncharacterized cupredoxin-like copper-binding protein
MLRGISRTGVLLMVVLLVVLGLTAACGTSNSDKTATANAKSRSTATTTGVGKATATHATTAATATHATSATSTTGTMSATATHATTSATPTHATTSATATKPSQGGTGGSPAAGAVTVKVTESEMKIELGSTSVAHGAVTFEIKNNGTIAHNLAVMIDNKEVKSADVQPGKTVEWKVTFPKAGTYELYCAVPGHKAAGMTAKLTIT